MLTIPSGALRVVFLVGEAVGVTNEVGPVDHRHGDKPSPPEEEGGRGRRGRRAVSREAGHGTQVDGDWLEMRRETENGPGIWWRLSAEQRAP